MRFLCTTLVATVLATSFLPSASIAASDSSPQPAPRVVSAADSENAFKDVPTDSFAYRAIQQLEQDGLVQGYPDGTFKGNRPITRYEAAAITARTVQYIERQLEQPQTAPSVSPADITALRTLLSEFKTDLEALKVQVAKIDTRLQTVEKTEQGLVTAQKTTDATLKQQQLHLLYFLRAPGSFRDEVSAYSATGVPLAPGTSLATNSALGAGVNTNRNTLNSGLFAHGTGYQVARVFFDGETDPKLSYHIRLENRYYFDNATNNGGSNGTYGTSSTAPNLCSGAAGAAITTCGSDYPTNSTLRLNYANVVYKDPSGFSATLGRYFEQNDALGLNYADYFNGAELAYSAKGLTAKAGYSFNFPSLSNGSGCGTAAATVSCGASGQTLFGSVAYAFNKQLTGQLSYATDINGQLTLWNPSAKITGSPFGGLYQASNVPISVGSAFVAYNPTNNLSLAVEGLHRFGNDPFAGGAWSGADALWAQGQYGAFRPTPNRGYIEGGIIQAGFNSVSGHTNVIGTTNYEQFYLANPNGYRIGYAGAHYWLSRAARIGVGYVHYDLIPGTALPASSATCPGCYVTHDIGNGVFLQTLLQF